MGQEREAEQRAEVAHTKKLADEGGGGRHGGQPGKAEAGGEDVEGQRRGWQEQVAADQHDAGGVHDGQYVLAAIAGYAGTRVEAAEDVGQADDGEGPAGDRRRQAAQVHLAGQMGDEEGDVKAAGEEAQVQEQVAAVGHRVADRPHHPLIRFRMGWRWRRQRPGQPPDQRQRSQRHQCHGP